VTANVGDEFGQKERLGSARIHVVGNLIQIDADPEQRGRQQCAAAVIAGGRRQRHAKGTPAHELGHAEASGPNPCFEVRAFRLRQA